MLGHDYTCYEEALIKCKLETLFEKREQRLIRFAIHCKSDKYNSAMFPENANVHSKEVFKVNFARTSAYLNSTIPQAQRRLNSIFGNI